jgi:glycosyltransferase involved in cell wall biosynthesis
MECLSANGEALLAASTELQGSPSLKAIAMTISIVIPTYNRAQFIRKAVESALNQVKPADEIIVVDDGSTDDTQSVLDSFGGQIRVITIRNTAAGPSHPRNVGIQAATSSHIMFLDSDDRLAPTAVSRCRDIFQRTRGVALVCTNYCTGYTAGDQVRDAAANEAKVVHALNAVEIAPNEYWVNGSIAFQAYCGAVFIKMNASTVPKNIIASIGGFDEGLRTANDFDFFLRVLTKGDMVYIDEPLHTIVRHKGNLTSANLDGVFRDYVCRNYIRVLEAQLRERRGERDTALLIRRKLQEWRLECAYGYRRSGMARRALRGYAEYIRHGGNLLIAARGICATVLKRAGNGEREDSAA